MDGDGETDQDFDGDGRHVDQISLFFGLLLGITSEGDGKIRAF
jgi:hypothetical protein